MKNFKKIAAVFLCAATGFCGAMFAACETSDTRNDGKQNDSQTEDENNTQKKRYLELTENYDFTALVSDKLTEEEWEAAFNPENYTTYTIKCEPLFNQKTAYLPTQTTENGDFKRHIFDYEGSDYEQYAGKTANGVYSSYMKKNNKWYKVSVNENDADDETLDMFKNWLTVYTMACPNFGKFYSSFKYDEDKGAYILQSNVCTNSTLEYWDITYNYAEVKIIDGRLAFLYTTNTATDKGNPTNVYFYDYDSTLVEFPEAEDMQMPE